MTVAVVIEKGTSGIPSLPARYTRRHTRLTCHVRECAIAIVVIQRAVAPIGYEQIVPPIIVVVAYTAALAPACPNQPALGGDVRKRAVTIVLVESARWRIAGGVMCLKPRPIHKENVEPAVVIEVEK